MNRVVEYIKLIPKGLPNSLQIIKGIVYSVGLFYDLIGDKKKKEIINRRMICLDCSYNNKLANSSPDYSLLFKKEYKTNRKDLHCTICGCPIKIRTASLDTECAIGEWNDEHKEMFLPLKWHKYN
jgi:transcription elongation factor Elf1